MRKVISIVILVTFISTTIQSPSFAQAVSGDQLPWMPQPGVMVHLSPPFTPAQLQGLIIHPDNALQFDFLINKGDQVLSVGQKEEEYTKLVRYFLASLTIPDQDQWVNLSPYEKNRIIKNDFGKTAMGRDLLAQDYLLKQITSSLIYPEEGLGREFWDKVYEQAWKEYGTTEVPVNTFNKVWIVPDQAVVYESGNTVYVLRDHLKVMLEEDYLSLEKHNGIARVDSQRAAADKTHALASLIIKQIILPDLEKEVNEGKNFANLRQIYSGMILATWYKYALKESLLGRIYANQAKVKGVDQNPQNNEAIYRQYLKAFKKGVFNYIKEDVNKYTKEVIPRKYFSGGTKCFTGVLSLPAGVPIKSFSTAMVVVANKDSKFSPAMKALIGNPVDSPKGMDLVNIKLDTPRDESISLGMTNPDLPTTERQFWDFIKLNVESGEIPVKFFGWLERASKNLCNESTVDNLLKMMDEYPRAKDVLRYLISLGFPVVFRPENVRIIVKMMEMHSIFGVAEPFGIYMNYFQREAVPLPPELRPVLDKIAIEVKKLGDSPESLVTNVKSSDVKIYCKTFLAAYELLKMEGTLVKLRNGHTVTQRTALAVYVKLLGIEAREFNAGEGLRVGTSGLLLLEELKLKAENSDHILPASVRDALDGEEILSGDGQMTGDIRNVVLSAIVGESMNIMVKQPWPDAAMSNNDFEALLPKLQEGIRAVEADNDAKAKDIISKLKGRSDNAYGEFFSKLLAEAYWERKYHKGGQALKNGQWGQAGKILDQMKKDPLAQLHFMLLSNELFDKYRPVIQYLVEKSLGFSGPTGVRTEDLEFLGLPTTSEANFSISNEEILEHSKQAISHEAFELLTDLYFNGSWEVNITFKGVPETTQIEGRRVSYFNWSGTIRRVSEAMMVIQVPHYVLMAAVTSVDELERTLDRESKMTDYLIDGLYVTVAVGIVGLTWYWYRNSLWGNHRRVYSAKNGLNAEALYRIIDHRDRSSEDTDKIKALLRKAQRLEEHKTIVPAIFTMESRNYGKAAETIKSEIREHYNQILTDINQQILENAKDNSSTLNQKKKKYPYAYQAEFQMTIIEQLKALFEGQRVERQYSNAVAGLKKLLYRSSDREVQKAAFQALNALSPGFRSEISAIFVSHRLAPDSGDSWSTIYEVLRKAYPDPEMPGEGNVIDISPAMKAHEAKSPFGGIDLNSANMHFQIKRDGRGVPLPFSQQDMAQLSSIQGFVPEIIEIRPATKLPIFSEIQASLTHVS